MQKHPILCLMLLFLFLIMLAVPALAEGTRFSHTADYLMDGYIEIDKEIGHRCTTGASKEQLVRGYGRMTKSEKIDIAPHIMAVEDEVDWVTADDAVRNLEVTSTIQLCARPLSAAAAAYEDDGYNIDSGDIISPYHPLVVDGTININRKTDQIFGSSASTDPGNVGAYAADFIAAYGPGPREEGLGIYEEDQLWEYDPATNTAEDKGDRYVGNYFDIDHYIYTSGGQARRYISISSPFSYALTEELMEVIGMAEVTETFSLDNLEPGPDAITLAWYELF